MEHIVTVAGDDERSERQGDDHADNAHQRAPEAETQQDSCRTEAGDLTHDLGREVHILNGLHYDEHNSHQQQRQPYGLPRLRRLHQA